MQSTTQTFTRQWPQAAARPQHHIAGKAKFQERFSIAKVEGAPEWELNTLEPPMVMRALPQDAPTTTRGVATEKHICVPHVLSFFSSLFSPRQHTEQPPPISPAQSQKDKPLPPLPQEALDPSSSPEVPTPPACALVRQGRIAHAEDIRVRDTRFLQPRKPASNLNPLVRRPRASRRRLVQVGEEQAFKHALDCDLKHRPGGEADSYYQGHALEDQVQDVGSRVFVEQPSLVTSHAWQGTRTLSAHPPRPLSFERSELTPIFQAPTTPMAAEDCMSLPSCPPRIPSLVFSGLPLYPTESTGNGVVGHDNDNIQETRLMDQGSSLGQFPENESGGGDGWATDGEVSNYERTFSPGVFSSAWSEGSDMTLQPDTPKSCVDSAYHSIGHS